jgi:UDP-N-acetylglucosamine 4,6-dehydratase
MLYHTHTVLIAGAGGSVGRMLMAHFTKDTTVQVRALERSEQAMAELVALYGKNPNVTLCLGDLLDPDSFKQVLDGCDAVIHCAALKHVLIGQTFPTRQARENVNGFCNILEYAQQAGVRRFLLCSTDKAATPTSVMGATKYLLERLCMNASTDSFSAAAVRFVNVIGSNGSLIPIIESRLATRHPVTLRHKQMTRYFMHQHDAVALICHALERMQGGEIFTYNAAAARVQDVMETVLEHHGADASHIVLAQEPTKENIDERLVSPEEMPHLRKSDRFLVLHGKGDGLMEHEKQNALSSSAIMLQKEKIKELLYDQK